MGEAVRGGGQEGGVEDVADEQVVPHCAVVLDLEGHVAHEGELVLDLQVDAGLAGLEPVAHFARVVGDLLAAESVHFDVGLLEGEGALEPHALEGHDARVVVRLLQQRLEVADVLDLAGLRHPVPLRSEPALRVELHHFVRLAEHCHEQEEAADYRARPPLSVVAVENSNSFVILGEEACNLVADDEECVEGRSLMVFPLVVQHILQLALFDTAPADVDGHVFVLVGCLQQFSDRIH